MVFRHRLLTVRVLIGHRVTLYSPTLVNRTVSKKANKIAFCGGGCYPINEMFEMIREEPDTPFSVLTRARQIQSEANSNAQRINEAESPRFLRQLDCNSTDSSTQTKIQNQWPAFYTNSSAFQCGQTTPERGECPHQPPAPEPGRG